MLLSSAITEILFLLTVILFFLVPWPGFLNVIHQVYFSIQNNVSTVIFRGLPILTGVVMLGGPNPGGLCCLSHNRSNNLSIWNPLNIVTFFSELCLCDTNISECVTEVWNTPDPLPARDWGVGNQGDGVFGEHGGMPANRWARLLSWRAADVCSVCVLRH